MSKNTWDTLAGLLWLVDFLGGATLVIFGFIQTFINAPTGWLCIFVGAFMLAHCFLLFHSEWEDKE